MALRPPSRHVKTIRELIYWYYADLIAPNHPCVRLVIILNYICGCRFKPTKEESKDFSSSTSTRFFNAASKIAFTQPFNLLVKEE